MKLALKKSSTDVTVNIFIADTSSTTGAGLTGLVFNSSGLTCYYVRPRSAAAQLTLVTQTVTGAHSDGGFVEVDATNMPGTYRLDLSDAILATGVDSVVVMLKGATNMAPVLLEIQLTNFDLNTVNVTLADGVTHGGSTAKLRLGGSDSTAPFYVTNSGGPAVQFTTSSAASIWAAFYIQNSGGGKGVTISTSGAAGEGVEITSATSSGVGTVAITNSGGGTGVLISTNTATNATGVSITGRGSGDGLRIQVVSASTGKAVALLDAASPGELYGSLNSVGTNGITANSLATDAGTEIADTIFKRDISAITGEASRSLLNAIRFLRNKWTVSGGTLTVTKEDDATSAWTATVTSSGGAEPITGVDPG